MRTFKGLALLFLAVAVIFPAVATGTQESGDDSGPVEVSWFVNRGSWSTDWDVEKPVHRIITQETGLTLNLMNSAGQEERLNTMIASGDLTDVITMVNTDLQVEQLEASGLLAPLDEVIPEHRPEFWERIPESIIDWWRNADGHWYGYPSQTWAEEDMTEENYIPTNAGIVARKDIMDELGISPDDFRTKAGMLEALRKVRDAEYTYDGLTVSPYWMTPNGGFPGNWAWVDFFAVRMEDEDGDLVDVRTQPRYLEHLLFMNQMYREGLLTADNFTTDRNQTTERIMSGRVFSMIANTGDYRWQYRNLYNLDNEAEYVPVGPLTADSAPAPILRAQSSAGWLLTTINEDSDHVDRIVDFMAFLTSEEGRYLTNYGIEGETYTIGSDGHIEWTETWNELEAEPNTNPRVVYGNDGLTYFRSAAWAQRHDPHPTDEGTLVQQRVWDFFGQWSNPSHLAFRNVGPSGGTDEAAINAQIQTYWNEQLPQMVLAESEADARAIYARSVERIEELGLAQVVAAQNAEFQVHKERMGLEYAWPENR